MRTKDDALAEARWPSYLGQYFEAIGRAEITGAGTHDYEQVAREYVQARGRSEGEWENSLLRCNFKTDWRLCAALQR